jgi:membrane-associated phospholipid phosphatase
VPRDLGFRFYGVGLFLGVFCLLGDPNSARAQADCTLLAPWDRLPRSLRHMREVQPLALAAAAPVPLLLLAPTGGDHRLRSFSQRDLGGHYGLEPVSVWVPQLLALSAALGYGVSVGIHACELARPLAAVLQGMGGGLAVTVLLKWSVGREWPNEGRDPHAPDRLSHPEYAHRFRPFGARLGAWPSGHTLTMFAAASALRAAEPELGILAWIGYPLAAGVGLGMWLNDRHWASDVLSGGLLGEAIGGSVGRSFAHDATLDSPGAQGFLLLPVAGSGALLGWDGSF